MWLALNGWQGSLLFFELMPSITTCQGLFRTLLGCLSGLAWCAGCRPHEGVGVLFEIYGASV